MVLKSQHKSEDFSSFHFQNALIDYDISIQPPPLDESYIEMGVSKVRIHFILYCCLSGQC
jgi:hypothetical protein